RRHSFSLDEITLEERPRYFPEAHSLGGLCREHSWKADAHITCLDSILLIRTKLEEGIIHWGKEATAGAVAPFGRKTYSPMPILVSPTCKRGEPASEMPRVYGIITSEWKVRAAATEGPLWAMTGDGDAACRASFLTFLTSHIYSIARKSSVSRAWSFATL
ncbi:hypothetical protein BOTBODRAFT_121947, partial [Botryobasidium botryosum FD-172 SS1]